MAQSDVDRRRVESGGPPSPSGGVTELMQTAKDGTEDVKGLLGTRFNLICRQDNHGQTALMWVAGYSPIEAIKSVLERGKDVKGDQDHSALRHALNDGRLEVTRVIISYEDPTDRNGVTALMRAAARGDTEMVRLLVPIQGGMKDGAGETALMSTARNGHVECLKLLLDKEEGMQRPDGWTALMMAALRGHAECVKLLLEKEGGMQRRSLVNAAENGDTDAEMMELLPLQERKKAEGGVKIDRWRMTGGTALMTAAEYGHADVVRLLVSREGGKYDNNHKTALMFAAQNGRTECARLLLEKEEGMKDSNDKTALMWAAQNGRTECVKLLLEKEARMKDSDGKTALMFAAQNGHQDCVKLLLEKEGGMQKSDGSTALMFAAEEGHTDCVRLLCEHKSERDASGWTNLMCAACIGDVGAVRRNIQETKRTDKYGWTALMWAVCNREPGCVRLLKDREKDLRSTREFIGFEAGTTALDIANELIYEEIIEILSE